MPVAYYVREQGGELLCYNRTAEKAKELINLFGGNVVLSYLNWNLNHQMSL